MTAPSIYKMARAQYKCCHLSYVVRSLTLGIKSAATSRSLINRGYAKAKMTSAILCLFWTFVSLAILAAGFWHAYGFKSSQIFNDILLFGKLHDTRRKRTAIQYIEVPKRFVNLLSPKACW